MLATTARRIDPVWLLAAALGVVSALVIATVVAHRAAHRATVAARHSVDQRLALRAVMEAVLEAESGQRGFLLTQDPAYLAPYRAAQAELGARLSLAAVLLAGTAPEIVPALRRPIAAKLGELEATVQAQQRGLRAAAQKTVQTDTGKRLMDDVRGQLAAADALLQGVARREREDAGARDRIATWGAAAAGLMLLLGAVLGLGVRQRLALSALTLRARAEAQREQTLAQLDALFANIPIGLALLDRELRYVRVNRMLAELGARDAEQYEGKTVTEVFGAVGEHFVPMFQRALAGEATLDILSEHVLPTAAEPRWYLSGFFPVRVRGGDIIGVGAVSTNVTELKRTQAALAALNDELEQRVAQRTERLAELNEDLEAFSYSVSHDLRAPLRAIGSYCQILQEEHAGGLDAEGRDAVGRARAAALRMGRLIDDMLALSRVTRAEVRRDPVDLSALAEHLLEELREHSPRPGVAAVIEPGLQVVGDERLLETALRNLLGNAWKFTARAAAPRIELRSERRDGRQVFLVEDNGAGFDLKYAGRLFAPFQRLHPQSAYEGTGIGLATVKRVITKHGGRVWVERAALQQGITIAFTLGGGAA